MSFKSKLSNEKIEILRIFSSVSSAIVLDFIEIEDCFLFIVKEGDFGKAIGLKGIFVKVLQQKLNKKIKIIEYSNELVKFINHLLLPYKADKVELQNNFIIISGFDKNIKSKIIGKNKSNLDAMNQLVKKFYNNIYEIKII